MRNPPPATTDAALEPVRAQLLRAARAEADALLAAADSDARAVLAEADGRAAAILAEARGLGEADAAAARDAARSRSRRTARARELAARRECWEELRRQVVAGVEELRHADSYPALRARLTAHVRAALGPDAEVVEAPHGGVTARTTHRRLDCGLTTLALRALERIGGEPEELWAP
ncbi:V-type ATP synthase subunit E family protein [Streptomyces sp. NPDC101209]|uniref:V-type ATP synthase subunit E family protein n=1 Tax=Streptomyces sp. NPDC101209 TaxID=3366129 RepID=UPI00381D235E